MHQLRIALKEEIPALICQARNAWRRDLPGLLKTNPGQWVAYYGDKLFGIARNKTELFQQCLRAGLQRGDFLVLRIEPETDQQVYLPVDV
jgi:hypothetical protein